MSKVTAKRRQGATHVLLPYVVMHKSRDVRINGKILDSGFKDYFVDSKSNSDTHEHYLMWTNLREELLSKWKNKGYLEHELEIQYEEFKVKWH